MANKFFFLFFRQETADAKGSVGKTVRDRRVLETLVDRGRRFAARQTRRIVHKDGSCNIASQNVTARRRRYLVDIFTTLVDMRWRYAVSDGGQWRPGAAVSK